MHVSEKKLKSLSNSSKWFSNPHLNYAYYQKDDTHLKETEGRERGNVWFGSSHNLRNHKNTDQRISTHRSIRDIMNAFRKGKLLTVH